MASCVGQELSGWGSPLVGSPVERWYSRMPASLYAPGVEQIFGREPLDVAQREERPVASA
jgi:hypothetical protein